MRKQRILSLLFAGITSASLMAADALFVVSNTSLVGADATLHEQLTAAGLNVVTMAANNATAADASGKSLVLISESVSSGAVNQKFRNVPVGVIVLEPFVLDDMLMVAGAENTDTGFGLGGGGVATVNIVKADHPLAAGFPAGETQVVIDTAPQIGWGNPTANAILVANLGLPGTPPQPQTRGAVWGYEKGAMMAGLAAPARRTFLFLHGNAIPTLNDDGFKLLQAAIDWTRGSESDLPPQIANLSPSAQTLFHGASNGISFNVTTASPNSISPNSIQLVLNGTNVSSQLAISGSGTDRAVRFSGLEQNKVYSGRIDVADNQGRTNSATIQFDTFNAGLFAIEAEDYNYQGGQFQNNPPPSGEDSNQGTVNGSGTGYFELTGLPLVDYFDTATVSGDPAVNAYRLSDAAGTRRTTDITRQKYRDAGSAGATVSDYNISDLSSGEWYNYTRTFANGNYQIYLRAASTAGQRVRLEEVTSSASTANQTVRTIGEFSIPTTGNQFQFIALPDALGTPAVVPLSGNKTLRLTALSANGNLRINFMLFAPVSSVEAVPPAVTIAVPGQNATSVSVHSPIEITISDRATAVVANSIQLWIDGTNVTARATVSDTADGATIRFTPNLKPGFTHTVEVVYSDNANPSRTHRTQWAFSTTSDITGPSAQSAGTLDGSLVGITFNEPVDPAAATLASNYRINGATVQEVRLSEDSQLVILTPSANPGNNFKVQVNNVTDRFQNPIAANTEVSGNTSAMSTTAVGDVLTGPAIDFGGGNFIVDAAGTGIVGSSDGANFISEQRTGSFDVRVRVTQLDPVNRLSMAGLMVRETLDPSSRQISAVVTPRGPTRDAQSTGIGDNDYQALYRAETGSDITFWPGSNASREVPYPDAWIRLKRENTASGDVFTAFRSTNGVSWTQYAQVTVTPAYPNTVHVGLVSTSRNNTEENIATAIFRNYGNATSGGPVGDVSLSVSRAASGLTLSWAASAANLVLESSESIGTSATWARVAETPTTSGQQLSVTIQTSGKTRFFRLRQP